MAYNYGPPGVPYGGQPPPYGAPSGSPHPAGMPPGFGPPPGMDIGGPPGAMNALSPPGMSGGFAPPPNFPANINFNAPVIRLGMDSQRGGLSQVDRGVERGGGRADGRGSNAEPLGNRHRAGLGAGGGGGGGGGDPGQQRNLERERQLLQERMMALQPPTREEVARTIFVGGLGEGAPTDEQLETILRCAGKLRRWTRARDARDDKCKFGFAEYEDVESLEAASEIYRQVAVPVFDKNGVAHPDESADGGIKTAPLLVVVDEQSLKYIEEWKGRRREDDDARQFRIDGCKEDLRQVLTSLANAGSHLANGAQNGVDAQGDTDMAETNGDGLGDAPEVVTIPLTLEDELSDIPAEMRATVAEEIRAFRDRSNRRDMERLRREEELEQAERQRSGAASRLNRATSPPPSGAPSGPASAANGIPVGPRQNGAQGVQGAPSGPKGYRGAQIPNDYVNGVAFVPGAGPDGQGVTVSLNREDDDAEGSDSDIERRREEKNTAELDRQQQDQFKRWNNRERARGAAQERERTREEADRKHRQREREREAAREAKWNDDDEARTQKDLYLADRSAWSRRRAADREREAQRDENERFTEDREQAEEQRKAAEARGLADNFLYQIGSEIEAKAAEQSSGPGAFGGFKISLGSAAAKSKQAQAAAAALRNAMADVEGLLEGEEDAAAAGMKRPELKPLPDMSTVPAFGDDLTDEEKAAARQTLIQEIPLDAEHLFAHPVKWESVNATLIEAQIRPFVERKVVEYLGVQEDLLVDAVLEGVKNKKKPEEIVTELEPALEDDAEALVKKVWRLLVFCSESESRGIGS